MITIALTGIYKKNDLQYAINSIMGQENSDIELIISMNELDISVCEVINTINGNKSDNIKRVLINTVKKGKPYVHMKYISSHISGERLLCLWDGTALYEKNVLEKISAGGYDKETFIECINVLYKLNTEYVGEEKGGILFPKQFVKSDFFCNLDLTKNIKKQIVRQNILWKECDVLLLKTYTVYKTINYDKQVNNVLHENLHIWENKIKKGALKVNYSGYIELCHYIDTKEESNDKPEMTIDEFIKYIIMKQNGGKWEIKESDKALIYHLLQIRRRKYNRYAKKRYIKRVEYIHKKKVVLVVNEYSLWKSCYKSIYDTLIINDYYVDIVYVPFKHNKIEIDLECKLEEWRQSGYPFSMGKDYNISLESPDIVFFCKPYDVADDMWCIHEIEKVIRRIIYIPYIMATMRPGKEIKRLMFQLPMHYIAWKQLIYNKNHKQMLETYSYNSKNELLIGHPKYDVVFEDFTKEEKKLYNSIKECASNKKIVLWNSHFAIDLEDADGAGTFLNFGIQFLERILREGNTKDYFVLWRPHPMFWDSIKKNPRINQINDLIKKGIDTGRLYVDRTNSQWPAIFASDILVSDSSSLIESWIIYNKPLILTLRKSMATLLDNILYKAMSLNELEQAIHSIIENGDELYDIRRKWVSENYYLQDGYKGTAKKLFEEIENGVFKTRLKN